MKKIIFFTTVLIWSFGVSARTGGSETNNSSIADIDCVQYTKGVAVEATSDSSPNNIIGGDILVINVLLIDSSG